MQSHMVKDLDLTNVEEQFLPPNTTLNIQPMDAGIIAAFKRRYRRYQLASALNKEEQGTDNIYKLDQLKAMNWIKAAWYEI